MTTRHGVRVGEVHHPACCTTTSQEPPTLALLPTLDRGALCHGTTAAWGNLLGRKTTNMMRVCFQNLDGISQSPNGNGNLKLHLLLQFTTTYQVDVFAAAELNTCWDLIPPDHWLP